MITLEYKKAALCVSSFYTSHCQKLEKRSNDAIFLEIFDALNEIQFFVDEIQEGDFEQLFIFRRPGRGIEHGGRAFIVVNMKRDQDKYLITQFNEERKGEFMSFDPAYWVPEAKEAWRSIFFVNLIWWVENYDMAGFRRDRLMHFSKTRLGSRDPNGIMRLCDYSNH